MYIYKKSNDDLEALMNPVRIFTDSIKMKFGISKCATLVMKRGRKVEEDRIQMPGGIAIEDLADKAHKYIGELESDKIKMEKMKLKVRQKYYRKVNKVLKSSLNGGNIVKAINAWAVAALRYTAGIID